MSALVNHKTNLVEQDKVIFNALKNSVYPGAKSDSVYMVLDYCKANKLDPFMKPVHIVPMSVKDSKTGKYEWRDVIMPGIGSYRIQASRSGQYAGISEPEFGEDVTEQIGNMTITYPKWCKITVKRISKNGQIYEFTAKELWIENYAASGKDDLTPNSMWRKRKYGQLAKCAEAQALRKAFPELVSHQPTAEEMEGKIIENEIEINPLSATSLQPQPSKGIEGVKAALGIEENDAANNINEQESEFIPPELATKEQVDDLKSLILKHGISERTTSKWLNKAKVECYEEMGQSDIQACIDWIIDNAV